MFANPGLFHTGPISGVAASREYVATAGYDNKVVLWSSSSHMPINRAYHDHLANQCEFSPDGTLLASAGSDGTARVFSVPDMNLVGLIRHGDDVLKATFSPDGGRIATCAYDGTIIISAAEGRRLAQCFGHNALVEGLAWSGDGSTCASCGTDGTIRFWNAETGACVAQTTGLQVDIDDIIHLEANTWIAGADDGRLIFIESGSDWSIPGHNGGVKSLSRRGDRLLSIGYDQRFIVWAIRADRRLTKIIEVPLPAEAWARSGCLLNDDKVIVASFGSHYLVYDLPTGSWDSRGYVPSPALNAIVTRAGQVFAVGDAGSLLIDGAPVGTVPSLCNAVALVGERVLVAGQTGVLHEAKTGTMIHEHNAPINRIEVISVGPGDIAEIALGCYDGAVARLSLRDGVATSARVIPIASSAIKGICSRDGRIFCGSAGGLLVVLDAKSDQLLHRTENAHASILNDVSFYAGGFVTVSRDLTLRCWTSNGAPAGQFRTRHSRSVKCVSTSDNGRYSACGSYGGTVDVFDHHAGQWIGNLRRPTMSGISSIVWDDQRQTFLAASYDGGIYEIQVYED